MGRLLGFGLILSGVLVGAVGVPLSASSSGSEGSVAVEKTSPAPRIGMEQGVGAPPLSALRPILMASSQAQAPSAGQSQPAAQKPAQPAATRPPQPLAQVAPEPRPVRAPAAPAARRPIVPSFETVTVPNEPGAITRALQSELIRVGCYDGPVSGIWSPATRQAMKSFTERVNAALPVTKPDFILLSLVKAQPEKVCSGGCPAGQATGPDGRCTPNAILAQAARKISRQNQAVAAKGPGVVQAPAPARPAEATAPAKAAPATTVRAPTNRPETVPANPTLALSPGLSPSPNPGPSPTPAPAATPAPAPAAVPSQPTSPFYAEDQRMALAGPKDPEVQPAPAATPDKDAKAKPRKRHVAPDNARNGQTRWARDFFRNSTF